MATFTVEVSSVAAGDWTLDAGTDEVTAVQYGGSHDDDTSKIQSLNSVGSYQRYTGNMTGGPGVGNVITQVEVIARHKRALSADCNFTLSYSFAIDGGGTQSGTSGTYTAGSAWATQSYTDSGLSAAYGSGFEIEIEITQARYMECSTLYAVITYTPAPTNQTLTGATIASGSTVYAPTKITKKLAGATIASTVAVNAPSMVTKKLAGVAIAATTALLAPAKVSFILTAPTIAATTTLYPPSSVTIAGAVTTLTGAHIAATTTLHAPAKVSFGLTGATIAETTALNAGMVYRGTIRIDAITEYEARGVSSVSFDHETLDTEYRQLVLIIFTRNYVGTGSVLDSRFLANSLPIYGGVSTGALSGTGAYTGAGSTGSIGSTADWDHIFYLGLQNPAVGNDTISFTFQSIQDYIRCVAIAFSGIADNRTLSNNNNNTGDQTDITTITVYRSGTTYTNGLALSLATARNGARTISPGAGMFELDETASGAEAGDFAMFIGLTPEPDYSTDTKQYDVTTDDSTPLGVGAVVKLVGITPALEPPAWATTTTLYGANVTIGQQLLGATIVATALYAPSVSYVITAPTIASGAALYAPAMITKRLAGATIAATALNAPTVVVGAVTLAGAHIASTVLYAFTVVPGGVTLEGATVAITPTVYTPVAMVPGGVRLTGRPIDIGTLVYTPARVLATYALAGAAIASTVTLYAPEVIPPTPPAPQTLTGATIAITPTVYDPVAMVPGGVRLTGRPLDVTTLVYAGVVANRRIVEPPLIASTVQVYAPAAAVRYYLIAPFIGCETPIGVNSPEMINLMTLYAMTMLSLRIYGATIASGAATHAPAAVTSGPRVQTGDVFPPIEVDTV